MVTTRVLIDGRDRRIDDPEDVARLLNGRRPVETAEVLFERDDGALLIVMLSGPRAMVLYQRQIGDPDDVGQSARDPLVANDADTLVEVRLSNGQVDRHPLSETVPRQDAVRAAEHFVSTGQRAPWLSWHDDNRVG